MRWLKSETKFWVFKVKYQFFFRRESNAMPIDGLSNMMFSGVEFRVLENFVTNNATLFIFIHYIQLCTNTSNWFSFTRRIICLNVQYNIYFDSKTISKGFLCLLILTYSLRSWETFIYLKGRKSRGKKKSREEIVTRNFSRLSRHLVFATSSFSRTRDF